MTLLRAAALPLAAALAASDVHAQAGSLEVKATDPAGAPLVGVVAKVDGVARGTTGADGRVKVRGLAPGWHALKLTAAGRTGLGLGVLLPPGGEAEVEVALQRVRPPVVLRKLDVVGRHGGGMAVAPPAGRVRPDGGVEWGQGDLRRAKAGRLSEVLRMAPGVELVRGPAGPALRFRRAFAARASDRPGLAPPDCAPAYYVDGTRFDGLETPDVFPVSEVEAVVLYPGNVPPAYGGMRASCGVVLIRTRGANAAPPKPRARPDYLRPPSAKHPAPPRATKAPPRSKHR
jgi:hypothetical protein